MGDNSSTNNQVPRVIKGTGFYTPMDLAPGEVPAEVTTPQPPATVGETVGLPTPMNIVPAETSTEQPSVQPPQSGDSGNAKSE